MPISHEVVYGSLLENNQPPADLPKAPVRIQGTYNGKRAAFGLTEDILSKHLLLVGGTGCGKTNLFYHIVEQLIARMTKDDVMLIFDSKGDFYNKFQYFNMSRSDCPLSGIRLPIYCKPR